MVWHAYLLNPRAFLEDCIRYGKTYFWRTDFPWAQVNACIDNGSFEFSETQNAIQNFEFSTDHPWSNLDEDDVVEMRCPLCDGTHEIEWTDWDRADAWTTHLDSSQAKA